MAAVETQPLIAECGDHVVHFYADDSELVGAVVPHLEVAEVAIVIATDAHLRAFRAELEAGGVDIAQAGADGRFVALDAATTLAALLVDGEVDRDAFHEVIGGLISKASASGRAVRAYGEMVALLWDAGNVLAAIELERLWNELARELPFSLFCAYPAASVSGSEHAEALHRVCHLHSSVLQTPVASEQELTASFSAERDAPGRARRLAVGALRQWGHTDQLVDDAALVLSELASNAVIHAGSPFSIVIRSQESRLRIAVEDVCPFVATEPNGGLIVSPEHGLAVIEALSARWGADCTLHGKVVWAELPIS
jgi:MEDS: MEthanogen/methylotroph, DcmR Sensory domain